MQTSAAAFAPNQSFASRWLVESESCLLLQVIFQISSLFGQLVLFHPLPFTLSPLCTQPTSVSVSQSGSMCCCCCVAAALVGVLSAFLLVGVTIWLAPYLLALASGLPQLATFLIVFSFLLSVNCSLVLSCLISRGKVNTERRGPAAEDGINTAAGRPGRAGLCRGRCSFFIIFQMFKSTIQKMGVEKI